jgi:hypothetical protein
LKKHNNSGKKSEPTSKPTKSRGPVQRDTKEVLAELVGAKSPALCRSAERKTDEQAKQSHWGKWNVSRITKLIPFGGSGCA